MVASPLAMSFVIIILRAVCVVLFGLRDSEPTSNYSVATYLVSYNGSLICGRRGRAGLDGGKSFDSYIRYSMRIFTIVIESKWS